MNILIIGASRSLGRAMVTAVRKVSSRLFLVSRSQPQVMGQIDNHSFYTWMKADVADTSFTQQLKDG